MNFPYRPWLLLVSAIGLSACGDDVSGTPVDAPREIDAPRAIDAPESHVDFFSNEGGEIRLEYMWFPTGGAVQTRARSIAFFYGGATGNGVHPMPTIPGCTDWSLPDGAAVRWPFKREVTSTILDVGQVIITGGPNQFNQNRIVPVQGACSVTTATKCWENPDCPGAETCVGMTGTRDVQNRLYKTPWHMAGEAPGTSTNNMVDLYIKGGATYDVILTGSPTFPAQILKDAVYVPENFALISPAMNVNPVLQAGTPLVIDYSVPAEPNKPADYPLAMVVTFFAGADKLPTFTCVEETIDGSITIPATVIDKVRSLSPNGGKFVRQHASHAAIEMMDGTTPTGKRIDVIGVWCYPYTFTIAP